MRNLSKLNKMFLCFRPVLDIDDMVDKDGSIKPENKTLLFPKGSSKFSQGLRIMQQPPKKTIIRVFQTILNRRASQKKNRYNRITDSFGALETKSFLKSPLSTRPSTPKATTSSSSLESKNLQTKQEQKRTTQVKKQTKFESYGIYLILMSLLFTVIWGKLVGIILTSMWLYLIITLCNSPSYYCSQKRLQRCSYPTGIDHRGNYGKCYSKHHN
ncbi:uncharacterized protein LOC107477867 [Arachis duranensis]|uniref:Uncharacterized protein LOC107477867 n=1 Tax=Arachis duranensis TaxID=130453 RepID=A0A6P4CLG6_ARADU|nr:uncharacterized protein LOC107477867 [Arachis duranensis]